MSRPRLQRVIFSGFALAITVGIASAAELPLTRVILSNSGLAQFIHAGPVTGDTVIQLPVRLDQVDDLLKSLTVFDKEGAVGAASLPGKTPLPELFRDLPFGPDALNSSADLLNALIGSEVEITGQVSARGRVFRVQPEQVSLPNNGGTITRNRLTLMTPTGMTQAILEDVQELRFTDPQTRAQIERLLAGLTENRAKDRRVLSLGFRGAGKRDVALSYVVAAPVWKTAYRLMLPKDGGKARLQGWAVVENLTGGDWKDVELTLVSGDPVALRQPLYTALFSDRPEVPVSTGSRLVPRKDDVQEKAAPAFRRDEAAVQPAPPARLTRQLGVEAGVVRPLPATGAAPPPAASRQCRGRRGGRRPNCSIASRRKLSLATGHTMMVPFVDREVPVTRIWLYQPDISPNRPLAAVRVTNDADSGLPGGLVTAFDLSADGNTNFVGDALLPLMPKAATRFMTFAVDTTTAIRRDDRGVVRTTLGKALERNIDDADTLRRTIDYEVTAPPDEDREIVVEEARVQGWSPAGDSKGIEETPTRFRHKIVAGKGATTKASFVVERMDSESVVLTEIDFGRHADDIARSPERKPEAERDRVEACRHCRGHQQDEVAAPAARRRSATRIVADQDPYPQQPSVGRARAPISAAAISIRSRDRKTGSPRSPPPMPILKSRSQRRKRPPGMWRSSLRFRAWRPASSCRRRRRARGRAWSARRYRRKPVIRQRSRSRRAPRAIPTSASISGGSPTALERKMVSSRFGAFCKDARIEDRRHVAAAGDLVGRRPVRAQMALGRPTTSSSRREPAHALHEGALDLAEIDRGIERLRRNPAAARRAARASRRSACRSRLRPRRRRR